MKSLHENVSVQDIGCREVHRKEVELLRGRLELLAGKDRILMTMYIEHGNSIRQIARLLGFSESRIARRIRKLTKSLIGSEYIECLRLRDRFSGHQLDIAKDYFLRGFSIRKIATRRNRSCYHVRQILLKVQNLVPVLVAGKD